MLLKTVNKYCPVASVYGIYSMGTKMHVMFGDIDLHIELKENKIIKTTVQRAFDSRNDEPLNIEFQGNDLKKVFKNKIVQNNIEYSILSKALLKQYSI